MKSYKIAVMPADGVGPEVVEQSLRVLKAAEEIISGFECDIEKFDVGHAYYYKTGIFLPDETMKGLWDADAIILGSIGQPSADIPAARDEKGAELTGKAMFKIRFDLDLFAGVRPVKSYPNCPTVLKNQSPLDFVILRENCEGLFASYGLGVVVGDRVATDTQIITREGSEKICEYGFKLAKDRHGRVKDGKSIVTLATKHNVLESFAFFRKIFFEVAAKYTDKIESECLHIDAMALLLLQHPEDYDVLVFENSHGDIFSDMCAALVGGMGMAPSGDIGYKHAMFQPSHGTAPTLAGKNVVNPTATILSVKMMLEWLSERFADKNLETAAKVIDMAVYKTFEDNIKTSDLGGNVSCSGFTDAVIGHMKQLKI